MQLKGLLAFLFCSLVSGAKRSLRGRRLDERPQIWTGEDWLDAAGDDDWMYPYNGHYINRKHWYTHFNPWSDHVNSPDDAEWLEGKLPDPSELPPGDDDWGSFKTGGDFPELEDAIEVVKPSVSVVDDDDVDVLVGAVDTAIDEADDAAVDAAIAGVTVVIPEDDNDMSSVGEQEDGDDDDILDIMEEANSFEQHYREGDFGSFKKGSALDDAIFDQEGGSFGSMGPFDMSTLDELH
jgi:hypothetical protein